VARPWSFPASTLLLRYYEVIPAEGSDIGERVGWQVCQDGVNSEVANEKRPPSLLLGYAVRSPELASLLVDVHLLRSPNLSRIRRNLSRLVATSWSTGVRPGGIERIDVASQSYYQRRAHVLSLVWVRKECRDRLVAGDRYIDDRYFLSYSPVRVALVPNDKVYAGFHEAWFL